MEPESDSTAPPRTYDVQIGSGLLTRLNAAAPRARIACIALGVLLFVASPVVGGFLVTVAGAALVCAGYFLGGLLGQLPVQWESASATVQGGALVLQEPAGRRQMLPSKSFRSALVLRFRDVDGPARLVIRRRWWSTTTVRFGTTREARAVLGDLGASPLQRPATFHFFFGLMITVGADGVLMSWPLLRRRRFLRYANIASMTPYFGRIVFELLDGKTYEVSTTTSNRSIALEQHDALIERIQDACTAHRAEHGAPPVAALERNGRSGISWVKELRTLAEAGGGGGYRAASIDTETLWNVALDPAAKEEHRIGAGLALRGTLDDAGRAKLRAAAEASASPKIRVVLEATADDVEDEPLGDALEQLAVRTHRA